MSTYSCYHQRNASAQSKTFLYPSFLHGISMASCYALTVRWVVMDAFSICDVLLMHHQQSLLCAVAMHVLGFTTGLGGC